MLQQMVYDELYSHQPAVMVRWMCRAMLHKQEGQAHLHFLWYGYWSIVFTKKKSKIELGSWVPGLHGVVGNMTGVEERHVYHTKPWSWYSEEPWQTCIDETGMLRERHDMAVFNKRGIYLWQWIPLDRNQMQQYMNPERQGSAEQSICELCRQKQMPETERRDVRMGNMWFDQLHHTQGYTVQAGPSVTIIPCPPSPTVDWD